MVAVGGPEDGVGGDCGLYDALAGKGAGFNGTVAAFGTRTGPEPGSGPGPGDPTTYVPCHVPVVAVAVAAVPASLAVEDGDGQGGVDGAPDRALEVLNASNQILMRPTR